MRDRRNAYRVLVRKAEGKIPLGRCRRRWEDNIKIDITWKVLKCGVGKGWRR
jgi:hypothetical protein